MISEEKNKGIPVIDLFAGPGGLAEGFSSVLDNNRRIFDIKLSIEKDGNAHRTLELRSFCRQFEPGQLPAEYYEVLKESNISVRDNKIQLLYQQYNTEYQQAKEEAWLATLGGIDFPSELIDKRITNALNKNKNWVLIGGPPCQAYSLVGRSRVGGVRNDDKRVFLYKEYLRIISVHQPSIFVMENVKGLLSARLRENDDDPNDKGVSIFEMILNDLNDPSTAFPESNSKKYRIYSLVKAEINDSKDYLIKSELYGVPEKRHRVILLGIREDLIVQPSTLEKKAEVSLASVIGKLPVIRSGLGREGIKAKIINGKKKRTYNNIIDTQENWTSFIVNYQSILSNMPNSNLENLLEIVKAPELGIGSEFICYKNTIDKTHPLYSWYIDKKLDGVTHHISRTHLAEDLLRYLFASSFTQIEKSFPRMKDYEKFGPAIMPDHENASSGKFEDRFRVQLPNIPATTVTCHISKDGHYFIHYDPKQCRSFTVREAARVQTFPDNYLFCGSRTAQFHQVGNAVPPYLAYQIGEIVRNILLQLRHE